LIITKRKSRLNKLSPYTPHPDPLPKGARIKRFAVGVRYIEPPHPDPLPSGERIKVRGL